VPPFNGSVYIDIQTGNNSAMLINGTATFGPIFGARAQVCLQINNTQQTQLDEETGEQTAVLDPSTGKPKKVTTFQVALAIDAPDLSKLPGLSSAGMGNVGIKGSVVLVFTNANHSMLCIDIVKTYYPLKPGFSLIANIDPPATGTLSALRMIGSSYTFIVWFHFANPGTCEVILETRNGEKFNLPMGLGALKIGLLKASVTRTAAVGNAMPDITFRLHGEIDFVASSSPNTKNTSISLPLVRATIDGTVSTSGLYFRAQVPALSLCCPYIVPALCLRCPCVLPCVVRLLPSHC